MYDDIDINSHMTEDDISYVASLYQISKDMARGMNDDEWCNFLGVALDDLALHLLEDEDVACVLSDAVAQRELEDAYDGDEPDDDEFGGRFTEDDWERALQSLEHQGVSTGPVREAYAAISPSPHSLVRPKSIYKSYQFNRWGPKPDVIEHHFEIVK